MQAYGKAFARVYNMKWGSFAARVAPAVLAYYLNTPLGQSERTLLDLCCGPGHLTRYFLERGFNVTGIDLSADMLVYARQNAGEYLSSGQASFLCADAADFRLDAPAGLAVSTYDALNHLPSLDALAACFRCTYAALRAGGTFIFDLNTRAGLRRWTNIHLEEDDDVCIINRGMYDRQVGRAYVLVSGFARVEGGLYERFEELVYNTAFVLAEVEAALRQAGFSHVHFARLDDLAAPLADPEAEPRAFVVVGK
jgi:SAM-dependent methyltransferase